MSPKNGHCTWNVQSVSNIASMRYTGGYLLDQDVAEVDSKPGI